MNRTTAVLVGIVSILGAGIFCCLCVLVVGGRITSRFTYPAASQTLEVVSSPIPLPPTSTIEIWKPVNTPVQPVKSPTIPASATEASGAPTAIAHAGQPALSITGALEILKAANVPASDLRDLAERYEGKRNIPLTVEPPPAPFVEGTKQPFWVINIDTNENKQIDATLEYVTDHVYFWVQDGVDFNRSTVMRFVNTFENEIYSKTRAFFGSEWSPGVDGDPHLYILYAKDLGANLAGYFSSVDEVHPLVHEYSNAHEMFMLNSDRINMDSSHAYGILAHEFQHMIHWFQDRNEETWMQEGFSELASFINGYDVGGSDYIFTQDPDLQLTDWSHDLGNAIPHYGAAFLFLTYFLDRFGEQTTRTLIAEQANGMASIDKVLAETGAIDPLTGKSIHAEDVFADWTIASMLQDPSVADGRYTYHIYPEAPRPAATETIRSCRGQPLDRDVSQFGVDYIEILCPGDHTLTFTGETIAPILSGDLHSGDYAFWSNHGDESDMTLTRQFDFRNASGPLSLNYWTWYELEENYDFVYLSASTDGVNWQLITTPSGTPENVSGNNIGWGYTGNSGDGPIWIKESVDLSRFAGQETFLRFEYVTDTAVNESGFWIDDISIPEIGYATDVEADSGGWEPDGFVRIENKIPQTYRLTLIQSGDQTTVQSIELPVDNQVEIPFHIGDGTDRLILAVSGTSPFTRVKAPYSVSITP